MEGSALCASRALIQKSGEICPLPRAHSAEMEAKMGGKAEEGELTNEADRPLIRRVMGQMKKMNSQAEGMRRHGSGDMTTSADREAKVSYQPMAFEVFDEGQMTSGKANRQSTPKGKSRGSTPAGKANRMSTPKSKVRGTTPKGKTAMTPKTPRGEAAMGGPGGADAPFRQRFPTAVATAEYTARRGAA